MLVKPRILFIAALALLSTLGGTFARSQSTPSAKPRPAIIVTAVYPGANAQTVADTVAAPIEALILGVEKMVHMTSRCANDGSCSIAITFEHGVNLDQAQVLVQNRVGLASPVIPQLVQNEGIRVKKQSAGLLLFVKVFSPDGKYDNLYLSNYSTIQIED